VLNSHAIHILKIPFKTSPQYLAAHYITD